MRKAVVVVVLAALVLLLAVPVTTSAGSSRYQFPKGSKITVTVGAPDPDGACPVTFQWPSFPKSNVVYGVRASAKAVHTDTLYTNTTSMGMRLPPGNWTVVVEAYDGPNTDPVWRPGPVLDSLKASFSVR